MSNEFAYETKWGYVTYSYEDYKNLKRLNFIFQKARLNASRWERWVRKAPHNRLEKSWLRNELGQKIGYTVIGPLDEPRTCDLFSKKLVDVDRKPLDRWFQGVKIYSWFEGWIETDDAVELEYRKSRTPVADPQLVEGPEWTSKEIEDMLSKAEAWYLYLTKEVSSV